MSELNDISKDITMSVMFKEYSPSNYPEFVSIANPKIGSICYFLDDSKGMVKVRIKSGKLWGTHGLSNCWTWVELETGKEVHGYGNFFRKKARK